MRLFSEIFGNNMKFATQKQFNEAFNIHYASLQTYTNTVKVKEGDSFVLGTKYFIALGNDISTPSETSEDWLYLGDSNDYVALEKLTFGEESEDYTARFGSSLYFLVHIDNERVLASNATVGIWHSSIETKITVQAINKETGEKEAIVISAKISGKPIQSGRNYESASVLKFFFLKEDNPNLTTGEYAVSFYTVGKRWHERDEGVNLLVEGIIVVE
jgi:hypothetical protein